MLCRVCNLDKNESDFAKRSAQKRHKICKSCKNAYNKTHYRKVSTKHKAQVRKSTASRIVRYLKEVDKLKDVPCLDCRRTFPPYVMDFDHRPNEEKLFTVSEGIARNVSMRRIMSEIEKCDIVCSNCHRIRTYQRRLDAGTSRRDR